MRIGHIPEVWQLAKVIFIPKPGKASYSVAKAYRPISLTSFMLKTMERLVDFEQRSHVPVGNLAKTQHAHTKGKSVDTALHNVVHTIEEAFAKKEMVLGPFIDIEGAFNRIKTAKIISCLVKKQVDPILIRWITTLLTNRQIYAEYGNANTTTRKRADLWKQS